jgi:apolipoprotein N-acyltransferase
MLKSITATRWTAALVAFAMGALFSLAFAPFYYWPLIFVCLPIFYQLLKDVETSRQAMLRGFAFGYGFFMAGTWWIGNALLVDAAKFGWMLPFSVLGLSAVMALWFMVFGVCCYSARKHMSPILFTLLWLVVELLRSLGMFGFPWNLAGYASLASLELAQLASVIGVYGVGACLVWLALVPIYWMSGYARRTVAVASVAAAMLLLAAYGFGAQRLATPTLLTSVQLRIVQPDIPQEVKGTHDGAQVAAERLEQYTTLREGEPEPDITIWPETAYPFTIREDRGIMLPGFRGVLLTGAVRAEGFPPQVRIWNSLLALSPSGDVRAVYDKYQRVPFGEFVPLRTLLPLDKITPGTTDFSAGSGPVTLTLEGLPPFSPQICYEGIFSWLAVDAAHRPAWMLNVTNDAWYGNSPGPYQHFDMVRMRSIEQGLPMVRAANNGISAIIDAQGRMTAHLPLGVGGVVHGKLPQAAPPTFYSRLFF